MKKNLFISTGYFATLSSSIIIDWANKQKKRDKKNYLLIIISKEFSTNSEFKNEVKNQIIFAKKISNWHKIDVLSEKDFSLSVYDNKNYDEILNSLFQGEIMKVSFFELYISSLYLLPKLSSQIKFDKVSILDEGIGTHLQLKNSSDLSNFTNFYKLIPLDTQKINSINLPKILLYKKLNKLNKIYKIPKIKERTSIIAISSFYFIQEEKLSLIEAYKRDIRDLIKEGKNVKIKLHPRNNKDDFIDFSKNLLDENIPLLDMYLLKNRKYIKSLFSMNSSILFMAKYVYDIPVVFIENNVKDEYTLSLNDIYKQYIN